ncbi:OmpP1/FadL family transporter [Christiangramia aquimixticola]|uniref:OmpP1/FadL family transporter n=1 Tax=Christiangramia aquimixticola TaxID=1697558 RepID=UPI003AA825FB
MKKLLYLLCLAGGLLSAEAQTIDDAYRYSTTELNGSARFIGMSGAFGSLGGDISAIAINPASSAVFLHSAGSLSFNINDIESDNSFNREVYTNGQSDFSLGNLGGVFVFNASDGNKWGKISLGINYSEMANYDDNFGVRGFTTKSIDQYFLQKANGISLDNLQRRDGESVNELYSYLGGNYGFDHQQAFLGYQAYVIEAKTNNPNNTEYFSLVEPGTFDQQYQYAATGVNGKLSFNLAGQYSDWLYVGANLNTHFINYERSSEISEFNNNSSESNFNATTDIYFGNNLSTSADGFSLQLGGIAKVGDNIRLGYTYQSPTWFNIREETSQYLETNSRENDFVSIAPNVINIYPEYTLQLPATHTTSISFLFGKSGLISGDFGFTDYSNMKYKPEADLYFQDLNNQISSSMGQVTTLKLGGEYRFDNLSLRAGYRLEGSPFEGENTAGELTGYSGGLGYRFGNLSLDVAYALANYDSSINPLDGNAVNPVYRDRSKSQVVMTLSFGL